MSRQFPAAAGAAAVLAAAGLLIGWNPPPSVARQAPGTRTAERHAVPPSGPLVEAALPAAPGDPARTPEISAERARPDVSSRAAGTLRPEFSRTVPNPGPHLLGETAGIASGNSGGNALAPAPEPVTRDEGTDPALGYPEEAAVGHDYRLTVPVAVGDAPATLAGWVDFDRNGRFDPPERVQTEIAPGGRSATLEWTVPANASSGETSVRLRIGRDAARLVPAEGSAVSGQVLDQRIRLTVGAARPEISRPADGATLADTRPRISGARATAGATVEVREGATALCRSRVARSGDWSCRPDAALTEGPHTLTPVLTGGAGAALPGEPVRITVRTAAPGAPALTLPEFTNDPALRLTGTGEPGGTVVVVDRPADGQETDLCSTAARADGGWSCLPVENLADGRHRLTAAAADLAGNRTAGQSAELVVDTVAPDRPVLTVPAAGETVRAARPRLAGKAEPGALVLVTAGPAHGAEDARIVACGATAAIDGSWTCAANRDLTDGEQWLTVTATDRAGNGTAAEAVAVRVEADGQAAAPATAPTPAPVGPAPVPSVSAAPSASAAPSVSAAPSASAAPSGSSAATPSAVVTPPPAATPTGPAMSAPSAAVPTSAVPSAVPSARPTAVPTPSAPAASAAVPSPAVAAPAAPSPTAAVPSMTVTGAAPAPAPVASVPAVPSPTAAVPTPSVPVPSVPTPSVPVPDAGPDPVPPGLLPIVVPPVTVVVARPAAPTPTAAGAGPTTARPTPSSSPTPTATRSASPPPTSAAPTSPAPTSPSPGPTAIPTASPTPTTTPAVLPAGTPDREQADRTPAAPPPAAQAADTADAEQPSSAATATDRHRSNGWRGALAGVLLMLTGIGLITRRVVTRGSGPRRR
ncbi:Ig-like domain-containing protein [Kitasatospora sp. NPDC001527]|uniref:Ig-like domain-containing protein n=1 Tax=Kitasatospora sp. NPDC001527 TaxID=3154519 RepID=UPI00332ABDA8